MLKTLLTSFRSQLGRVVDRIDNEISGETGSNSNSGLTKNFQKIG